MWLKSTGSGSTCQTTLTWTATWLEAVVFHKVQSSWKALQSRWKANMKRIPMQHVEQLEARCGLKTKLLDVAFIVVSKRNVGCWLCQTWPNYPVNLSLKFNLCKLLQNVWSSLVMVFGQDTSELFIKHMDNHRYELDMTHRCLNAYHALGVIPSPASPVDECPESQWDHQGRAPMAFGWDFSSQPPKTESYEVNHNFWWVNPLFLCQF